MKPATIDAVKEKINQIKFGILKFSEPSMLSIPISFMIETIELTNDGYLWCNSSELPALNYLAAGSFRVKLKYIQKKEGLFIKLIVHEVIIDKGFRNDSAGKNKMPVNQEKSLLLKVRIEEIYCFQKTSTSPYSSYLEALSNVAIGNAPMRSAV